MPESVVPISKVDFLKIFGEEEEKAKKPLSQRKEKEIYELSLSGGWRSLKSLIERRIKSLQEELLIKPEMTVEQVGFKYLVAQAAIQHLKTIVNYVENVRIFFEEKEKNAVSEDRKK